jgi:acyl carrier protein
MPVSPSITARVQRLFDEALNIEVPSIDTDVIESGLIDSLALVELLAAIEEEFEIELPLDELDVENLRSVETISEFVTRSGRLNGASPA